MINPIADNKETAKQFKSTGLGSSENRGRANRGGNWAYGTGITSVSFRYFGYPFNEYTLRGFRIVRNR